MSSSAFPDPDAQNQVAFYAQIASLREFVRVFCAASEDAGYAATAAAVGKIPDNILSQLYDPKSWDDIGYIVSSLIGAPAVRIAATIH